MPEPRLTAYRRRVLRALWTATARPDGRSAADAFDVTWDVYPEWTRPRQRAAEVALEALVAAGCAMRVGRTAAGEPTYLPLLGGVDHGRNPAS